MEVPSQAYDSLFFSSLPLYSPNGLPHLCAFGRTCYPLSPVFGGLPSGGTLPNPHPGSAGIKFRWLQPWLLKKVPNLWEEFASNRWKPHPLGRATPG